MAPRGGVYPGAPQARRLGSPRRWAAAPFQAFMPHAGARSPVSPLCRGGTSARLHIEDTKREDEGGLPARRRGWTERRPLGERNPRINMSAPRIWARKQKPASVLIRPLASLASQDFPWSFPKRRGGQQCVVDQACRGGLAKWIFPPVLVDCAGISLLRFMIGRRLSRKERLSFGVSTSNRGSPHSPLSVDPFLRSRAVVRRLSRVPKIFSFAEERQVYSSKRVIPRGGVRRVHAPNLGYPPL